MGLYRPAFYCKSCEVAWLQSEGDACWICEEHCFQQASLTVDDAAIKHYSTQGFHVGSPLYMNPHLFEDDAVYEQLDLALHSHPNFA